ncbi:MAG: hypothetical protein GY804_04935 [Alphaproteobacteria bacterium]|nr:hypothetical protein [Alphaproteobacteria bacterium]
MKSKNKITDLGQASKERLRLVLLIAFFAVSSLSVSGGKAYASQGGFPPPSLPETKIKNSFNGNIEVKGSDTGYAIIYEFPGGGEKMCRSILNMGWGSRIGSDLAVISVGTGTTISKQAKWSGSSEVLPLSMSDIDSMCGGLASDANTKVMISIRDALIGF